MNDRAWHQPTADGRWPVKHKSEDGIDPSDIKATMLQAVQVNDLVTDLRDAFHSSGELAELRAVFDPTVKITMRIESSRRYTRIFVPDVPVLRERLVFILNKHGLQVSPDTITYRRDYTVQLCTLRIGPINEILTYGEVRAAIPA